MQANTLINTLEQQAIKAFPLTDYADERDVIHARKKWIEAKKYLIKSNLEIKPIINVKQKAAVN